MHKDFEGVMEGASQAIEEAQKRATFKEKELRHRRGGYGQVTTGVSYGVGRTAAMNLKHKWHDKIIAELLQNKDIQQIAGFASAAFKMCAPRLYEEYRVTFNEIFDAMPTLTKNFANRVWTAAGVNMGPGVATFPHRHLVLYELGLILEFPAGSLILLPSATLTHANTPIQDGEFTPGGIFRYVDNGFRTEGQLKAQDKAGYKEMMEKKKTRWEEGLKKLSTLDELRSGRGNVGADV
ncbi:hypothetical protein BKA70DRAFT_1503121 [Coprinopsis sp. MPI-PUGE-AT-0042]|nr:hypothetical protein BKA70DRAFT_1503121 [Coprinopsis sp. MPI-PUGE-AT-0042]